MTGAELARRLDLSSGTYSHWKKGKIPNGETLLNISNILNISVDYLLGKEEGPEEGEIISYYRKADQRGKNIIYNTAKLAAEQSDPSETDNISTDNQHI